MADFIEVMKTCNRMCKSHYNCQRCDMHKLREAHERMTCEELLKQYPEEALQVILTWADNNPVPEYPTWAEWLQSIGAFPGDLDVEHLITISEISEGDKHCIETIISRFFSQIPQDIAEKFEIKPKERVING